jgi:acyl carrier protein
VPSGSWGVPAVFVPLDGLPLTVNGKVDRGALPATERARPEAGGGFVAPRDPLELRLTNLWEEVLGVRPIGVTDNVFELGGHSLAAVRLFALIEKRLGKKVPLATVFQGATVEHPAGGHVFPYVDLANCLGRDQPCYGLQARGVEEGQERIGGSKRWPLTT